MGLMRAEEHSITIRLMRKLEFCQEQWQASAHMKL